DELAMVAGAPLLGRLPIDPAIARLCDAGDVEDYESEAYHALASSFAAREETLRGAQPAR
ncbi:MAG: hypothetical protein ACYC1C_13195, partial [Chloroflexota bacterium]